MARSDGKTPKKNKTGTERRLRRILLVIAGLILGLNLYRFNASALAGNALPMPFGIGVAVVLSGSMSPALEVNDVILVRETDSYEVGDIVVYQKSQALVVHRVIAKDGETLITRGDANNAADAPIKLRAVKGEVIAHVPAVGLAVNVLKSPAGILAVLIAAFALTELFFRKEKDKDEKELEAIKEEILQLREKQEERE